MRATCPSCVTALPPGVDDEGLEQLLVESNAAVACTSSLLKTLISGDVELPDITFHQLPPLAAVVAPEADAEMLRLQQRMGKAGKILQDKRARTH